MKRCKKCLLPEVYPNIFYNEKKICNYCLGTQHFGVENDEKIQLMLSYKIKLKEEFENLIEKCKGKSEYDCLLLFSGGKDSTYLLYLLKQNYNLKILAYTVDTGFMNPIAKKNIEKVVKSMNVDHIFYKPGNEFFNRLYRYYLTQPNFETFCDKICGICSEVIHGFALIEASKRKIPFVILGNSPDQTDHCFYEISKEKIIKSWIPKEFDLNKSHGIDKNYFWNPKNGDYIPRFFIPFHVIDYPGEKAIIEIISKLGLLKKEDLNPLKNNCSLVWLLQYMDLNRNGYTPYIKNISRKIQSGKLKINKLKKLYYILGMELLKLGIVKTKDKKNVLKHLDLEIKNNINGKILIKSKLSFNDSLLFRKKPHY